MYEVQNEKQPMIGDVFMVEFDGVGSEQRGLRSALIFQNNKGNLHSPNVIVLPLTSKIKKTRQPTHVFVPSNGTNLKRNSIVLCENPMSISKTRLGKYVTTLPDSYMGEIAAAHLLATSAIAYMDMNAIADICNRAAKLNSACKAS